MTDDSPSVTSSVPISAHAPPSMRCSSVTIALAPCRPCASTSAATSAWSRMNTTGLADYEAKNAAALARLRTEFKAKVEILPLPADTMKELKKLAFDVVKEESEKSPMAKKVYASYQKFDAIQGDWGHISEGAYHSLIAG